MLPKLSPELPLSQSFANLARPIFIDIGHTALKWRTENDPIRTLLLSEFEPSLLPKSAVKFISCVTHTDFLKQITGTISVVKTQREFRLKNQILRCGYANPAELGSDRWLSMIAAFGTYREQNLLIIDAGSALTFDVVLADGQHQGGLIMPGLSALRQSFAQFQTPNFALSTQLLATNTRDGWLAGTTQMLMDTIERRIAHVLTTYSQITVLLTGGNRAIIAAHLSDKIRVNVELVDNLVLDGLAYYAHDCQHSR